MSERGLVVHQGSLSTIETALADATTAITTQIDELLEQVESLTPGLGRDQRVATAGTPSTSRSCATASRS